MVDLRILATADEVKALKAIRKLSGATDELSGKTKKFGRSSKSMTDAGIQQLTRYAAGFVSVSAAIGLATKALRFHNEERQKGLSLAKQGQSGFTMLAQQAMGDPELLAQLIEGTKTTFGEGRVTDIGQAAQMQFGLSSANAVEMRKTASRLAGIVQQPGLLVKAANTIQTALGRGPTGGLEDIISRGFAASGKSPSEVEAILQSAARGGDPTLAIGGDVNELIAGTTVLANVSQSAEEAGTLIKNFLGAVSIKPGFERTGIRGAVTKISEMGLSRPELVKFLGGKEATSAFGILERNLSFFDEIVQAQQIAVRDDLTGNIIRTREENPLLATLLQANKAKNRVQLKQMEKFALKESQREEAVSLVQEKGFDREEGFFTRFLRETFAGGAKGLSLSPKGIISAGEVGRGLANPIDVYTGAIKARFSRPISEGVLGTSVEGFLKNIDKNTRGNQTLSTGPDSDPGRGGMP